MVVNWPAVVDSDVALVDDRVVKSPDPPLIGVPGAMDVADPAAPKPLWYVIVPIVIHHAPIRAVWLPLKVRLHLRAIT